jgi:hypothetical protein
VKSPVAGLSSKPSDSGCFSVAVVSDIHYASPGEKARGTYYLDCINNPLRRVAVSLYRRWIWQRDPFAHNHLLPQFIQDAAQADLVVANGDYSCDSGFVGLADEAACQSTRLCLGQLRDAFGPKFIALTGDHEFGKKPLGAALGGPRLIAYERARELGMETIWVQRIAGNVLIGVSSSLLAWPVLEAEALSEEVPRWRELSAAHLDQVRQIFSQISPIERVILFCHDPTALPYLWQIPEVRARLPQITRTVIGHLHTPIVLFLSRFLAGIPVIRGFGHTPRRLSEALRQARFWKPFRVLLCPSLAGIELWNRRGYLSIGIEPGTDATPHFQLQRLTSIGS